MPALRILHVTPYYEEAWAYGGIPRLAGTLARGLARRGHRVTVCTTDVRDASSRLMAGGRPGRRLRPWPAIRAAEDVDLRIFPNLSNTLAYRLQLFVPLGLGRYLQRQARSFDIAHLHGCHNLPGAVAARHLRRAGTPYVLEPNGTAPRIERRRLAKYLFDHTLGRGVIPGASRVIAVSEAERRQLRGLGVADERIRGVPNPVDLSEFEDPPRTGRFRGRFDLGPGPVVLFLGKLTPRKRVDLLAHAFASLRGEDRRLVIAGNDMGAGPGLVRLVRRLGIGPVTRFTGLLEGRERLEALAEADVVVYPSRDEVFGLVPLEALLSGTPVVVADDSGCGEVVRRVGGGLVVPQGDTGALAEAISAVLDTPTRWRAAAVEAQGPVRRLYGNEAVCEEMESLYHEVVGSTAPIDARDSSA